jgi:hypothetical protein
VGILRTYSNHNLATRQLNDLIDRAGKSIPRGKTAVIAPRAKKLTPVEVDALCSLYQSGSSTYSLAKVYGIRRDRVSIILKRAGVTVDPGQLAKLSEKDKDRAAELYRSGLSLRKVGLQLGVTDNTVTKALDERAVTRRFS